MTYAFFALNLLPQLRLSAFLPQHQTFFAFVFLRFSLYLSLWPLPCILKAFLQKDFPKSREHNVYLPIVIAWYLKEVRGNVDANDPIVDLKKIGPQHCLYSEEGKCSPPLIYLVSVNQPRPRLPQSFHQRTIAALPTIKIKT